jgi:hypothetical protein
MIQLVGPRGAGKTTIGAALGQRGWAVDSSIWTRSPPSDTATSQRISRRMARSCSSQDRNDATDRVSRLRAGRCTRRCPTRATEKVAEGLTVGDFFRAWVIARSCGVAPDGGGCNRVRRPLVSAGVGPTESNAHLVSRWFSAKRLTCAITICTQYIRDGDLGSQESPEELPEACGSPLRRRSRIAGSRCDHPRRLGSRRRAAVRHSRARHRGKSRRGRLHVSGRGRATDLRPVGNSQ